MPTNFRVHVKYLLKGRFRPFDYCALAFLYLAIFSAFANAPIPVGLIILAISAGLILMRILGRVCCEVDAIGYVRRYIPEASASLDILDNTLKGVDSDGSFQVGKYDRLRRDEIESTISDCAPSIRYLQGAEVFVLLTMLMSLLFCFVFATIGLFEVSTYGAGSAQLTIVDHVYHNVTLLTTIGFDGSMRPLWPAGGQAYNIFATIAAVSVAMYTLGFVSLVVTNIVSIGPQALRDELLAKYV